MKPGNSPSDFAEVVHVQHTRPVIFGYIPGENEPSNSYAECRRQQRLVGMAEDYGTIGRRARANRGIVVFGQLKEREGRRQASAYSGGNSRFEPTSYRVAASCTCTTKNVPSRDAVG